MPLNQHRNPEATPAAARVALITGAASGIGPASARALAAAGIGTLVALDRL